MRISDRSSDVDSSDPTIVDAINDNNVLPFRIDYINTIKAGAAIHDKQVSAIDTERALLAPERISQVAGYIREHFDQKTKRSASYRSEEHTSELQSLMRISYAVFCLKKKKQTNNTKQKTITQI